MFVRHSERLRWVKRGEVAGCPSAIAKDYLRYSEARQEKQGRRGTQGKAGQCMAGQDRTRQKKQLLEPHAPKWTASAEPHSFEEHMDLEGFLGDSTEGNQGIPGGSEGFQGIPTRLRTCIECQNARLIESVRLAGVVFPGRAAPYYNIKKAPQAFSAWRCRSGTRRSVAIF